MPIMKAKFNPIKWRTSSRLSWFLLLPGLLCLSHKSHGQSDSYSVTTWRGRDGLPEMSVQALAVDPARGLVVGTAGGLCQFDGTYCAPLQNQEVNKLPASYLTTLLRDRDQSLWAGTRGAGLVHIAAGTVEIFEQRSGLSDLYIRALFQDSGGHLWVGTDDGLFRKAGETFQRVPLSPNAEHHGVYAIAEDSQRRLIIGSDQLIYLDGPDRPVPHPIEVPSPFPIRSLLVTKDGRLIVGTLGGVYERVAGQFARLPAPNVDVERLCQSADGAIWAGTVSNGLWRLKEEKASQIPIGNDESSHSIQAMTTDPSGNLWVGTETGLSRIEPTNVHLIPSPAAAVDSETLALSPKGAVFLVNNRVYRIDSGETQSIKFSLPRSPNIFFNILFASDDSVWIGTGGNGVYRLDSDGHTTQYSTYSPLKIAGNFPRGIVEGANGDIWVATGLGLDKIRRTGVEEFNSLNGLPNRNVRALLRDRNGCMWVGTDGGPAVYCQGHFVENRATQTLGGEEISAIAEDSNGTTWLGTRNHGLYAFRGSDLRHITTSDGLLSNFIGGLAADNSGTLWISSPDAISSILFDQPLRDRDPGLVFARSYPLPEGAEDLRFSEWRFPNIVVDPRGIVWFATNRGPVYVEKSLPSSNQASDRPVPVITSIRADDVYLHSAKISVPAGSKLLTFNFGSIYLGSEQDILLAYRLEGTGESWTVSTGSHQVEYRSLPAGSYTFELRAYSRARPEIWKSARVSLVIPVVWYRSAWFYLILLSSLAALSLSLYMLHLQRVKGRFKLILEERTRLAREMHDTLIQGCNGVALLLEANASSRTLETKYLDLAREQLHVTIADAREAVWNLRQSETDAGSFIGMLKQLSTQASKSFGISVALTHPPNLPRLPAAVVHEVLMIVREAVTNAGSHGRPRAIGISAQYIDHYLILEVSDDGVGFNIDVASSSSDDHYGILGMHERAKMIGANLEITSTVGAGTCVQLLLRKTAGIADTRTRQEAI
jgi:ligand-binding sensor domain-containing protein/signal transduction histidine kinase